MNFDNLKCVRCNLLLSVGPIKHSNGFHCGRCPCDGPRVEVYEQLARMCEFPCRYEKNGCSEKSTFNLIGLHENTCEYKNILCILPTCKKTFKELYVQEHYESCHPENFATSNIIEVWQGEKMLIKLYHTFYITCLIVIEISTNLEVIVTYFGQHLRKDYKRYKLIIHKNDMEQFWTLGNREVERYNRLSLNNKHYSVSMEAIRYFCGNNSQFWIEIQFPDAQDFNNTKLSKDILQIMECPICYETLYEITQCRTGHSICKQCAKNLKKCPTCNSDFLNITNYLAENLVQIIDQPCKNQDKGCAFTGKLKDKTEHEKFCFDCPFFEEKSCKFIGNAAQLIEHCLNDHSCYTNSISNDRFSLKEPQCKKLIYCQEKLFIYERLAKGRKIYFQAWLLRSLEDSSGIQEPNYMFAITFQNQQSVYKFSDQVLQFTNDRYLNDSLTIPESFLRKLEEDGLITCDFKVTRIIGQ